MTPRLFVLGLALGVLASCGPDYINLVHSDHPPEFQQVATVERAQAYFTNSTIGSRAPIGPAPKIDANGLYPVTEDPVVIGLYAEYIAPNGIAIAARQGSNRAMRGQWRLEQSGNGYPRLCRKYGEREWVCSWPSSLLRSSGVVTELYRGDVLGLASGRMPSSLRSDVDPMTIAQFHARRGRSPSSLQSLQIQD